MQSRSSDFGGGLYIVTVGASRSSKTLQKTKYHLRIASASGEANAITSVNADHIDKIVQAVNEAMIKRG